MIFKKIFKVFTIISIALVFNACELVYCKEYNVTSFDDSFKNANLILNTELKINGSNADFVNSIVDIFTYLKRHNEKVYEKAGIYIEYILWELSGCDYIRTNNAWTIIYSTARSISEDKKIKLTFGDLLDMILFKIQKNKDRFYNFCNIMYLSKTLHEGNK